MTGILREIFLEHTLRSRRWLFWLMTAGTFVALLLLNGFVFYCSDDYRFMINAVTGQPTSGLGDIFQSLGYHYVHENGRVIPHFFAYLALWMPKAVFNVLNSLMYVALCLLVYKHANLGKPLSIKVYAFVLGALFLWLPAFGDTVLWADGSCNYMWGMVCILAFLLVYRTYEHRPESMTHWWSIPAMLVFGALAGGYNENTSAAALLFLVLWMIREKTRKRPWKAWMFAGLAGGAISWLVMILAPANRVRVSHFHDERHPLLIYAGRFMQCTRYILDNVSVLIVVFIVLLALNAFIKQDRSFMTTAALFFVVGIAGEYAMILPPSNPQRAFMGPAVFLIIATAHMLAYTQLPRLREWTLAAVICMMLYSGLNYGYALVDSAYAYRLYTLRQEEIEAEKAAGNRDIETYGIACSTKYSPFRNYPDLKEDPTHWANTGFCRYNDLDSVVATEVKSY